MKRHQLKILFGISIAWVIAVAGNGCGSSFGTNEIENDLNAGGDPILSESTTAHGIRTINQVGPNMISVTQYVGSVDELQLRFEQHEPALSVTGLASTVSPPMMMALGAMAVEMCDQLLVNQEMTLDAPQRRYFKDVNFSQDLNQDHSVASWAEQMARDFFGREIRSTERDFVVASASDAFSPGDSETNIKEKANYVCGAMLGSLEANMIR